MTDSSPPAATNNNDENANHTHRKLSASQIRELTTSPDSLPLPASSAWPTPPLEALVVEDDADHEVAHKDQHRDNIDEWHDARDGDQHRNGIHDLDDASNKTRPSVLPPLKRPRSKPRHASPSPPPSPHSQPSSLPIPPLSFPTYLHLELSSERPSPLYIHPSAASHFPYESSAIKFERLRNFLILPLQLEQVLVFGAFVCLDAWLYTFTILPLRFLNALAILLRWMGGNASQEATDLGSFVIRGSVRVWQRWRRKTSSVPPAGSLPSSRRVSPAPSEHEYPRRIHIEIPSNPRQSSSTKAAPTSSSTTSPSPTPRHRKQSSAFRHRRTRSTPSVLLPNHKADLLQGLLIAVACTVLMWFDASRMYHSIRGQAAIKLYVIYNVLEVFDRLLSAFGQDVLECLFSKETLERDRHGRSKLIRPFWMFLLALVYIVGHSTALFYQVVTLNVAVNSYSNALLTLLMSNQFVEIKGTVFKKFEKENLFQLTCADIVERFQLWLMLLIIALRNIVEVGGLSISLNSAFGSDSGSSASLADNIGGNGTTIRLASGFVIPKAFTLMPRWTGEVLGPFLIVLGSEALVDWCKHAYITKFNNVKPNIYGRFLDVLSKDYYSHAFADQNLTKRLGLPVIPLSCLFIRAVLQTYHMFLATHMPAPLPSAATSISVEIDAPSLSSSTAAALAHFDQVLRRALGRSSFGSGTNVTETSSFSWWGVDDFLALATMISFFLVAYLLLLAFKLLLGMALLVYSRNRYASMKDRERQSIDSRGRRVGGWGTVEVNEDKRRWIYDDDPEGHAKLKERDYRARQKAEKGEMKLENVDRYTMVAKRIW